MSMLRVAVILEDSYNALIYSAKPELIGLPSTIRTCLLGLEEFVAVQKSIYFNGLQHKNSTV